MDHKCRYAPTECGPELAWSDDDDDDDDDNI